MAYVVREAAAFGSILLFGASCLMWGEALTTLLP